MDVMSHAEASRSMTELRLKTRLEAQSSLNGR